MKKAKAKVGRPKKVGKGVKAKKPKAKAGKGFKTKLALGALLAAGGLYGLNKLSNAAATNVAGSFGLKKPTAEEKARVSKYFVK